MRILVVDDEALARDRLSALLQELGDPYEVVGTAANGEEALALFAERGADLALMDIRMPVMDGLQAATALSCGAEPPAVIFTTAYEEHALQAFDAQAVDYLLKPVRKARLQQALERAKRLTLPQLQALCEGTDRPVPVLRVNYRGGVKQLPLDQVLYLRAESKYVIARHRHGELLLEESLKTLESRFGDWFLRIHRNALVARQALIGLQRLVDGSVQACLRGCEERLEVSRRHQPQIRRWLKDVE
ncbi:MAG: LytTR family DNA-binding domain-containing protein [Chromatiales bacterium]|jgi:two-component system response regulator AlgR